MSLQSLATGRSLGTGVRELWNQHRVPLGPLPREGCQVLPALLVPS